MHGFYGKTDGSELSILSKVEKQRAMADEANVTDPPNISNDLSPPQPKVQKVVAVEEVKETVAAAVQDALRNFSASAGDE